MHIIRPRTNDRTLEIAESILDEMRNQGPKLINTMYDEKCMSACVLKHMYNLSVVEAEDDERMDRRMTEVIKASGIEGSAQRSPDYTHEYEQNMAK